MEICYASGPSPASRSDKPTSSRGTQEHLNLNISCTPQSACRHRKKIGTATTQSVASPKTTKHQIIPPIPVPPPPKQPRSRSEIQNPQLGMNAGALGPSPKKSNTAENFFFPFWLICDPVPEGSESGVPIGSLDPTLKLRGWSSGVCLPRGIEQPLDRGKEPDSTHCRVWLRKSKR